MSTKVVTDLGENISNAVQVLQETYKNVHLLLNELDRIGEKEGYTSLTPKFLRWKSDSAYDGWLTSNFIKLYQLKNESPLPHLPNMTDGLVYGIEVDLVGEENYPTISLIKYTFDFTYWTRTPAISDHWVFWDPFRNERFFEINHTDGIWTSTALEKGKTRYWGLENASAIEIPLVSVSSPEDISEKIFKKF
ncbi:hypothetical protein JOC78_001388 [Bacillus ectoiniformans]|uniref:hypothetical protein n=1 Tax=Bacillus ectoiniformans TaxID=1494429 RepID=UPI001958332B|nr:hypothetical protein [Bacillus ectoiniformans]MBM7648446.1 hypothetical protein [Bacillus ectoiniformans]